MSIRENLLRVKENIRLSAESVGRNPADIKLVVVTKNRTPEQIREVLTCGHYILGENRLQEAKPKIEQLPANIEWHFIGHLQTNKAKQVAELFYMIHSLDRLELAVALQKAGEKLNRSLNCLVEVNVAGEETKFGISPEQTIPFIRQVAENFDRIKILGLMTMAPYLPDPEQTRPVFRRLRQLRDEINSLQIPGVSMQFLSMGMTNDYQVAITEGANIIRLGTAIFGT
ncbi:MAG: YggS family pyridoxal phosphate-dependent enzyme [Candidatus Sumerlaeia bacterium]|nr:YggS family pyridoxal phosphate-dependent enzyme [Candidatus Sumerlaeia bacterium]